ncbi:MAG TPA: tetratricopeptide repeat protein [Azospira sp.]|nr:tetratricopeptide repeat protein [Nitrospira sp.]HNJ75664.1 tetratricopeptide repeat protein [Azospira sp.]
MIPFNPNIPDVLIASLVREYRIGPYRAKLYQGAKSLSWKTMPKEMVYEHPFVLWVIDPEKNDDRMIVAAEKTAPALRIADQPDEPFLCVFTESAGHLNLGPSPDWSDLEKFSVRALQVVKEKLKVDADAEVIARYPVPSASGKKSFGAGLLVVGFVALAIGGGYYATHRHDVPKGNPFGDKQVEATQGPEKASTASKPQSLDEIISELVGRAEAGELDAHLVLGKLYRVTGKPAESNRWLSRAVDRGYASAMAALGSFALEDGDTAAARRWFEKAAMRNDPEGLFELSKLLDTLKTRADQKRGMELLKRAAELGWPEAQFQLAMWLALGHGVKADVRQANTWAQKAAERGDVGGQNMLCEDYIEGSGVPRDYLVAADWCTKAAAQGNYSALAKLAYLYENGFGVGLDGVRAYALYNLILDSGSSFQTDAAKRNLNRLERMLSPAQINEGQRLSRTLLESGPMRSIASQQVEIGNAAKRAARDRANQSPAN